MKAKNDALLKNDSQELLPISKATNIINHKWMYKIKRKPNKKVKRYTFRVVAKGFHQKEGVDLFETFSYVIKTSTLRMMLNLALSRNWIIRQLDVNIAYLHWELEDVVYLTQLEGFEMYYLEGVFMFCKLKQTIWSQTGST